jgi:hypothetical protein
MATKLVSIAEMLLMPGSYGFTAYLYRSQKLYVHFLSRYCALAENWLVKERGKGQTKKNI